MSEPSTNGIHLDPYPGIAAGEAIVHGLKIASSTAPPMTTSSEGGRPVGPSSEQLLQTDTTPIEDKTNNGQNNPINPVPTPSSAISSNATLAIDSELISAIFEGLARQHEQLVAQLTTLSDVITKDAVEGIDDLVAAAEILEDIFYRIDVLHAKVEYLNYFVVQPLSQAVKVIHKPKDLKGKAMSVLKSFGFKSSSTDESEAEAMWARIPPFVIISDPPTHPTAGPSHSTAAPPPGTPTISFAPNISLLGTLSDHYQLALKDKAIASGASTSTNSYFQKGYTIRDEGTNARHSVALTIEGGGAAGGGHGKNLQEFRKEVLEQSVYIFEQSTARN